MRCAVYDDLTIRFESAQYNMGLFSPLSENAPGSMAERKRSYTQAHADFVRLANERSEHKKSCDTCLADSAASRSKSK